MSKSWMKKSVAGPKNQFITQSRSIVWSWPERSVVRRMNWSIHWLLGREGKLIRLNISDARIVCAYVSVCARVFTAIRIRDKQWPARSAVIFGNEERTLVESHGWGSRNLQRAEICDGSNIFGDDGCAVRAVKYSNKWGTMTRSQDTIILLRGGFQMLQHGQSECLKLWANQWLWVPLEVGPNYCKSQLLNVDEVLRGAFS